MRFLSYRPPKTKCSPRHVTLQAASTPTLSSLVKLMSRSSFPEAFVMTGTNECHVFKIKMSAFENDGVVVVVDAVVKLVVVDELSLRCFV